MNQCQKTSLPIGPVQNLCESEIQTGTGTVSVQGEVQNLDPNNISVKAHFCGNYL